MSSVLMGAFFGAVAGGLDEFPPGTEMLFRNSSAPVGWTKSTNIDNIAFRCLANGTTGGNSVSGNINFNAVISSTQAVSNQTITTPYTGSHSHNFASSAGNSSGNANIPKRGLNPNATSPTTTSAGSSGSHSHNIAMGVYYADVIRAIKDA